VDANGILNVSAVEKSTGKSNKVTIKNDRQRSKEEIESMVADAARFEEEDKALMAKVEARNKAEAYLYQARSALQEEQLKTALGDEGCASIETVVKSGLEWLENNKDASRDELETQQKVWEDTIRPLLAAAAPGVQKGSEESQATPEPKIEEVD